MVSFFSFQKKSSKSKAKKREFLMWEYVDFNTGKNIPIHRLDIVNPFWVSGAPLSLFSDKTSRSGLRLFLPRTDRQSAF